MRNGGLAGYSSISVDLGGFTNRGKGEPLEEQNVMRRIVNMAPVAPICKFQGANDASSALPWLYTAQQQQLFRFYLKLRYRLHPYYYSSAIEAHLTGRPILAPLVFDYQDDENTYDKDFHFMLGRQILIAPVMEKTDKWRVYLPKGRWIHYWTGKEYSGGQTVTVNAPLYGRDGLPMFVKAGAIIPMIPEMNYIYEKAPNPITLDVYPYETVSCGESLSDYVMYDCDAPNRPIKKMIFNCLEEAEDIKIRIDESDTAYELWVHHEKQPASVTVDSKELPKLEDRCDYDKAEEGWYWGTGCFYGSDELKTLNIKISEIMKAQLVRIKK
jgi:alpha-glucosidase